MLAVPTWLVPRVPVRQPSWYCLDRKDALDGVNWKLDWKASAYAVFPVVHALILVSITDVVSHENTVVPAPYVVVTFSAKSMHMPAWLRPPWFLTMYTQTLQTVSAGGGGGGWSQKGGENCGGGGGT